MLITPTPPSPDEVRRQERMQEYWETLSRRIEEEREERQRRLRKRETTIAEAVRLYRNIDHGDIPWIGIRHPFITLQHADESEQTETHADPEPTQARRTEQYQDDPSDDGALNVPSATITPLARLIHRQGRSLSLYLTILYISQLQYPPGTTARNIHAVNGQRVGRQPESWTQLAAMTEQPGTVRARRARAVRALDELAKTNLVTLRSSADRYERFEILKEDASGQPYRVPGQDVPGVLRMSAAFYYYGWHLVLSPKEVAAYLVFQEASARLAGPVMLRNQHGVALPRSERVSRYCLSDEVYESIHSLHEFGLIQVIDPMPSRRHGRFNRAQATPTTTTGFFPIPYQVKLLPIPPEPAYEVVARQLSSSAPSRTYHPTTLS